MKRVVIFSDSHGDEAGLRYLLDRIWMTGGADLYLHLGDGARDFEAVSGYMQGHDPRAGQLNVRGNCDFCAGGVPDELVADIGGVRLFLCHGHRYQVKQTYDYVEAAAKERGCQAALFGHTHHPMFEMRGVLLLNPGSAADGRAAVLTIDDEKRIKPELIEW